MDPVNTRRSLGWLAIALAACGGNSGTESAGAGTARVIPVAAAAVERRDVPVFLEGLGSAAAWKTVTVRPQIDGRLDRVLFTEGQAVKRGDLLAEIDPRAFQAQLHQAEGALARDSAQLHDNQTNLGRYEELRQKKLVPQQQVDDQRASVGQFEGAVRIDQAQVEAARLNLDYARIRSPIDGVTGVRLVDAGNIVRASDAGGLVVITQLDPIAVLFTLPQDDLHRIQLELQKGPLLVEAYSRDGETKLATGELALIDNQINQATSTARLKAVFPNPQRLLWPNQFVKARLRLTVRRGALVVPTTTVQRGPKGTFAYVIKADSTVEPRPIEIELALADVTLVKSGLAAGERVVVDGQNQLKPGSRVQPRDAGGRATGGGGGRGDGGAGAR